jgi:hypothetical protein
VSCSVPQNINTANGGDSADNGARTFQDLIDSVDDQYGRKVSSAQKVCHIRVDANIS